MMAHNAERRRRTTATVIGVAAVLALATAGGILLSASAPAVRLVAVTLQQGSVLIEATEPVAYAVNRPDPLTLVIDLRNVSVADAKGPAEHEGQVAGVKLEQATAVDGASVARVRVALTGPSEYKVRSARNTIRVEFRASAKGPMPIASAPQASSAKATEAKPSSAQATEAQASRTPGAEVQAVAVQDPAGTATLIERIRSSRTANSTIVTLTGNGQLVPASLTEAENEPRRLVLDFPNVSSKAPSQVTVDSPYVRKVRTGTNSHSPLVTRVVMEIAADVTYHVERSGPEGRELSVVFEAPQMAAGTVLLAPPDQVTPQAPEPGITMEQAIMNAAAITPPAQPLDPMSALKLGPPSPATGAAASAPPSGGTRAAEAPTESVIPTSAGKQPSSVAASSGPDSQPRVAPPLSRAAALEQSAAAAQAPSPAPAPRLAAPPPAAARPAPQAPPRGTGTIGGQQITGDQQKKYTGHPISMDFQGADLRAVLRVFSETSGLNMVIDPDVQGTVDMILNEVPWDQALEVILRGNQLDYTVDGTIVRIARIDTLKKEQDARQALTKSAADAGTLSVRTFSLSYARAAAAAPLIKKAALSQRGDVQIDERTNTLIITDLPAKLDTAAQLLATIDRAEPQVEVEARIVQTTRDFARAVGIRWGLNGRVMPDLGNTTNLAFPNQGTLNGRLGTQGANDPRATPLEQTGTAVNLGVNDASSAIGLALGAVNGAFNLDIALSALERTGKGRVLSTPRLTTQNNIEAEVAQGIQIPIQTVANNTVTVSFKDAVLVLKVTPQITAANTVIMKITIENATPDFSRQVNGIPPIDTQRANTQVQIDDGSTTVIGGIFVSQEQNSNEKTPVLYRMPLLGWLFKRDRVEDSSRELLIFITPRILKG
jgi:type IV pilus secretin PilQ/predicted competence protein